MWSEMELKCFDRRDSYLIDLMANEFDFEIVFALLLEQNVE